MKPYPQLVVDLLRGEITAASLASALSPPRLGRQLLLVVVVLGSLYGACMGLYGTLRGSAYGMPHVVSVMVKVPALFLLTLAVTAPSMFVFANLARLEAGFRATVRLLLAATAIITVVLASFGPVTAFFTCCTKSHPFMQVLNVVLFGIAGLIGLAFLWRNVGVPGEKSGSRRSVALVIRVWLVVYGIVGLQMGWLLRPFVGSPNLPQQFLRDTEGNVLMGIFEALRYL